MADGLLVIAAAADSIRSYGEFPVIGARAAVWIAAEVHLMFAAFVLGVPMFAVVAEAIGIFGGESRYCSWPTALRRSGARSSCSCSPVCIRGSGRI